MIKFFEDKNNILAVMSERKDGSMKLLESGFNNDNRNNFFRKLGIDENKIISAEIAHGDKVASVNKKSPRIIKGVDALVTEEQIFLAVTVADCIPVYFYDEKNKIIGLAHAGWRGIVSGVVKNTLKEMSGLGAKREIIQVALGPGIKNCHFEIKKDTVDKFKKYPQFISFKKDKIFVDLFGIIKKQLLDFKIEEKNIFDSGECTFENKKRYFSYRRDKPEVAEVMIAVIGMKDC